MELVMSLWKLCDYFVPLCSFVIIFYDILIPYLPCRYPYIPFIYCTCWVPTISVLNLAILPCYSNPLLRRRRWNGILWQGVLGYMLPRLPFLWCYGVFHCSVSLRVILVFRDLIYIIIILYSWHLVICEHFWPYAWNNWSWVTHTMSTRFWHKNRVWQKWYQSCVNCRNASLARRVFSLILFSSICESTLF
jgi:hypothetical protein